MDALDSFGEWLRQRRMTLGKTRAELADCCGCSVSALRKIEADERRPSRQLAELLAACLHIAPDDQPGFIDAARGARLVAGLGAPQPAAALFAPAGLPVTAIPFIGRKAELAAVARLLGDDQCRLLTLSGPGGMGKTRLALEVARVYGQEFADGAFFVPMAAVSSHEYMVPAVANVIGLSFTGPVPPRTQLLYYLSNKRMLLVLDNLEHLLDGVDLLVEMVGHAPGLKLLVTSRERLAVQAEWLLEIEGLPVPADDNVRELEAYSAVALFVQGARRSAYRFEPSQADWNAIVRICRLLQGMPLAIELAAAWAPVLTCSEIAEEVEGSLNFLATKLRDVPERHRSLRAVFAHSWQLLSAEEQQILMRLSVFRGGFTREAAEAVAGAGLDTLRDLISKSHLTVGGQGRFDMHELLRQFYEEALEEGGEAGRARQAHSRYYLKMVAARQADLGGRKQLSALNEVKTDLGNIRAAWQWALANEEKREIAGAIRSLHLFYNLLSRYHEEIALFQQAADLLAQQPDTESGQVWRLLVPYLAYTAAVAGLATPGMKRDLERCLELGQAAGEELLVADCLLARSFYQMFMERDAKGAILWGEQSLERFRVIGDPIGECWALIWLSFFHEQNGNADLARACGEAGLEVALQSGNQVGIPFILTRFAATALCTGDYTTAERYYRQGLEIAQQLEHWQTVAGAQTGLALLHFLGGEIEQAQASAGECVQAALKINFPLSKSSALAVVRLCNSITDTPVPELEIEEEAPPNPGTSLFTVIVHWAAALRACSRGDAVAWEETRLGLQVAHGLRYPAMATWLLPVAAFLLARMGQPQRAIELLALASTHPLSRTGWMAQWAPLREAQRRLEEELPSGQFQAAWRRGEAADLDAVVGALLH